MITHFYTQPFFEGMGNAEGMGRKRRGPCERIHKVLILVILFCCQKKLFSVSGMIICCNYKVLYSNSFSSSIFHRNLLLLCFKNVSFLYNFISCYCGFTITVSKLYPTLIKPKLYTSKTILVRHQNLHQLSFEQRLVVIMIALLQRQVFPLFLQAVYTNNNSNNHTF